MSYAASSLKGLQIYQRNNSETHQAASNGDQSKKKFFIT